MAMEDDSGTLVRLATAEDVPALSELISASVRELQAEDYTMTEREGALGSVFGVDPVLIGDRTYFVAVLESQLCACGGWSRRATPFGTGRSPARDDSVLDPRRDAARIRALFVHPSQARMGLGTRILKACEEGAKSAGFKQAELTATLTGAKLFRTHGYLVVEAIRLPLENGEALDLLRMRKQLV